MGEATPVAVSLKIFSWMPQTVPWQELDGDWSYGLIWWCDPGEEPVLHLQLRAPDGRRWNWEIVLHGASDPNRPHQSLARTLDLQPEPETQ